MPRKPPTRSSPAITTAEDTERTFVVRIAHDLSEYVDVAVVATDRGAAEQIVADLLHDSKLDNLKYELGDSQDGPHTCDSWEMDEADQVACTIKNGTPVFPQPPDALLCPHCGYDGTTATEHGGTFRYLSDQTIWREVVDASGSGDDRKILIDGKAEQYDEDEERNERLECRNCLKEFPIPTGLETDFN